LIVKYYQTFCAKYIAMAKAQMSLSLAQTVIERVVQGWNDISTTR